MSYDKTYIGYAANSLDDSEEMPPVSKVIVKISDNESLEAGDDSGSTVTYENPFATKETTEALLKRVKGYKYKPFETQGAYIDPATEVGDGVDVGSIYGTASKIETTYGKLVTANVSSPWKKQIDNEIPHLNKTQRKTNRAIGGIGRRQDKTEKAIELLTGIKEIKNWDPETGVAVAETAIKSAIIDNKTGKMKEAWVSAIVARDSKGNMKSLAQVVADVIDLQGNAEVLGNLSIKEGRLQVAKSIVTDGDIYCRGSGNIYLGEGAVVGNHGSFAYININGKKYEPKEITFVTGTGGGGEKKNLPLAPTDFYLPSGFRIQHYNSMSGTWADYTNAGDLMPSSWHLKNCVTWGDVYTAPTSGSTDTKWFLVQVGESDLSADDDTVLNNMNSNL